MGSYKWGYQSPNLGPNYSYPTYNSTSDYPSTPKQLPMNLQVSTSLNRHSNPKPYKPYKPYKP